MWAHAQTQRERRAPARARLPRARSRRRACSRPARARPGPHAGAGNDPRARRPAARAAEARSRATRRRHRRPDARGGRPGALHLEPQQREDGRRDRRRRMATRRRRDARRRAARRARAGRASRSCRSRPPRRCATAVRARAAERRRARDGGGAGGLPAGGRVADAKIKKAARADARSRSQTTPDILARRRSRAPPGAVVVGFALETDDVARATARASSTRRRSTSSSLNDATEPGAGFARRHESRDASSRATADAERCRCCRSRGRRRDPRSRRASCSMDAREQLRRYLEQRRELGETELVLDSHERRRRAARCSARRPARRAASAPASGDADDAPVASGATPATQTGAQAHRATAARRRPKVRRDAAPSSAAEPMPPTRRFERRRRSRAGRGARSVHAAERGTPRRSSDVPAGHRRRRTRAASCSAVPPRSSTRSTRSPTTVATCTRCPLYATATNPVPGEGNPNADLMCVGEAPGANEDETGRPFVGAGRSTARQDSRRDQLRARGRLHLQRPQASSARQPQSDAGRGRGVQPVPGPPDRADPAEGDPRVRHVRGPDAARHEAPIGKLRGQVHRYYGIPLVVTYHPAALLRNPAWKRPTWEDVQLARRILDRASAGA